MSLILVEENPNFARDEDTGCIVNVNDREFELAKSRLSLEFQLDTMKNRVNILEEQITLILKQLNESMNNGVNNS